MSVFDALVSYQLMHHPSSVTLLPPEESGRFNSTWGEYGTISTLGSPSRGSLLVWEDAVSLSWAVPLEPSSAVKCLRFSMLMSSDSPLTGLPERTATSTAKSLSSLGGAFEGEALLVIEHLHMGQFCLIFSHGSTHFLWNSCLGFNTIYVLVMITYIIPVHEHPHDYYSSMKTLPNGYQKYTQACLLPYKTKTPHLHRICEHARTHHTQA